MDQVVDHAGAVVLGRIDVIDSGDDQPIGGPSPPTLPPVTA
jgi:hypothetical protein